MFDIQLYKQLFADANYYAKKNSEGILSLDAIIVKATADEIGYTNIGYVNGPAIPYVRFPAAANDG